MGLYRDFGVRYGVRSRDLCRGPQHLDDPIGNRAVE